MSFRERVYQIAKRIPKGKVATYGQIANLVGNPKAARAVGMCMKTNPSAPFIPCHRVVGATGKLTGYTGGKGIPTKRAMLASEDVLVENDKVDLSKYRWRK